MEKPTKNTAHAPYTTLLACITKSGKKFTQDQIMKMGKEVADSFFLVFGSRPRKVETLESGKVKLVNIYPRKFAKTVIKNIITAA